jgi:hypothetical protein
VIATATRPLPTQSLHVAGKMRRLGLSGCATRGKPVPLHAGQRCSAGPSSRSVPFLLELLLIPPSMVFAFVITLQPGGSSTLSVTDVGHVCCGDHPHILPLCTVGDIKVPMGMAFSDFAQFAEALLRAIQAANFGLTPSPAKPTSPMRAAIAWKSARQR